MTPSATRKNSNWEGLPGTREWCAGPGATIEPGSPASPASSAISNPGATDAVWPAARGTDISRSAGRVTRWASKTFKVHPRCATHMLDYTRTGKTTPAPGVDYFYFSEMPYSHRPGVYDNLKVRVHGGSAARTLQDWG